LRKRPLKLIGQPYGSGGIAIDPMGNNLHLPEKKLIQKNKTALEIIKSYLGI
jgi:hypothetical protein